MENNLVCVYQLVRPLYVYPTESWVSDSTDQMHVPMAEIWRVGKQIGPDRGGKEIPEKVLTIYFYTKTPEMS